MTVLGRLFERRSLENPTYPLTSAALLDALDGTQSAPSGVRVTEESSLRHIAVYRCVELIAGTCAALPLKAYRKPERAEVDAPVLYDPHPELTKFEVWEFAYTSLLLWGNAYFRKATDGTGRVRRLWPLQPWRVKVEPVDRLPVDNPNEFYTGAKRFIVDGNHGNPLTRREILHIPGLGYDGLVGMSRIRFAAAGIGAGLAADEYAGRFFGNHSTPSGILSTDQKLDQESADRLKFRWKAKTTGANAHDIAILDKGTTFQPISIPAKDAQLLETRQYSTTEIARLFGLPPHAIGDVEKSTSWGSGIEQQTIGMVQFTLQPSYLTRVEERVTKEVLEPTFRDSYAEYAVEGLLRGDSAARGEFNAKAITNGWATRNEVRVRENVQPVDGGDDLLLPAGVLPETVAQMKVKVEALGALVRAGFEPAAAAEAVGLDPIAHTGLVPITVAEPADDEGSDDEEDGDAAA